MKTYSGKKEIGFFWQKRNSKVFNDQKRICPKKMGCDLGFNDMYCFPGFSSFAQKSSFQCSKVNFSNNVCLSFWLFNLQLKKSVLKS
jgi:hypothetical protein